LPLASPDRLGSVITRLICLTDWALPDRILHREVKMNRKSFLLITFAAGCVVASTVLVPNAGHAQVDARVTKSMESLKGMTAKLGTPFAKGRPMSALVPVKE
jgi:hypothetical protein